MESTCWNVRPDTCENGFMSTVKDCLQFPAFGKRHNFCQNEQTCPGAQWNTAASSYILGGVEPPEVQGLEPLGSYLALAQG